MNKIQEKKELILVEEQTLAALIAARVIEKPKLSWWMIIMPIIFVFFFQKLDKAIKGRELFVVNYMIIRNKALDAAYLATLNDKRLKTDEFYSQFTLPDEAAKYYRRWVEALIDFYSILLQAEGKDFSDLACSAFNNKKDLFLTMRHLCDLEQEYNEALLPHLVREVPEARKLTLDITVHSRILRMELVQKVFE